MGRDALSCTLSEIGKVKLLNSHCAVHERFASLDKESPPTQHAPGRSTIPPAIPITSPFNRPGSHGGCRPRLSIIPSLSFCNTLHFPNRVSPAHGATEAGPQASLQKSRRGGALPQTWSPPSKQYKLARAARMAAWAHLHSRSALLNSRPKDMDRPKGSPCTHLAQKCEDLLQHKSPQEGRLAETFVLADETSSLQERRRNESKSAFAHWKGRERELERRGASTGRLAGPGSPRARVRQPAPPFDDPRSTHSAVQAHVEPVVRSSRPSRTR